MKGPVFIVFLYFMANVKVYVLAIDTDTNTRRAMTLTPRCMSCLAKNEVCKTKY